MKKKDMKVVTDKDRREKKAAKCLRKMMKKHAELFYGYKVKAVITKLKPTVENKGTVDVVK